MHYEMITVYIHFLLQLIYIDTLLNVFKSVACWIIRFLLQVKYIDMLLNVFKSVAVGL